MNHKSGLDPELVQRVKNKLSQPAIKQKVKHILLNVSKEELQDVDRVRALIKQLSGVLREKFTSSQEDKMVSFIISQQIDPGNAFQLFKLWGMFR